MDLSAAYVALLTAVGALRLVEMRISRRRQRALAARGVARAVEPRFPLMVALHVSILAGSALEVWYGNRPLHPALAAPMLALVALANGLRFWVIRTLGPHWNVHVMGSLKLGVVSSGPYRFIRHPNYVAVWVELLALPLIHTAWVTALVGSVLHATVLRGRLAVEDPILLRDPGYRAAMGGKPRFIPGW